MDHLLPQPLPYIGTLVGIAVLMSASAASSQGLQNLALGLKERRYIPPLIGEPNKYQVADKPVWIEVAIVSICFLLFGTHEETYLAIYAAGVFILLSMTGWAVTKRLVSRVREKFNLTTALLIFGTIVASLLTTGATLIIFEERFLEGAWTYLLFIPVLYAGFTYFRNRMGEPIPELDYLGQLDAAQLAGFGFGQMAVEPDLAGVNGNGSVEVSWQPDPVDSKWYEKKAVIRNIAVLLDSSKEAAQAIPMAKTVARSTNAQVTIISAIKKPSNTRQKKTHHIVVEERNTYLKRVVNDFIHNGIQAKYVIREGSISDATKQYIDEDGIDLVVTTTRGKSGKPHWLDGGISRKLVQMIDLPILIVKYRDEGYPPAPTVKHIMVALDGSVYSERSLPYARVLAKAFGSDLSLLSVPAVPEVKDYRAPSEIVEKVRQKAEANMRKFLQDVARPLRKDRLRVKALVRGSIPARTIIDASKDEKADMVMITSRGRGSLDLLLMGSVADEVVRETQIPIFMIPVRDRED
jgi:nucleotide-binding universal stress UspA family protein